MSTRCEGPIEVGMKYRFPGGVGTIAAVDAENPRAVEAMRNTDVYQFLAAVPAPPVERALAAGWKRISLSSFQCDMCSLMREFHGEFMLAPSACAEHAELMGVFASPEPKAEAAKAAPVVEKPGPLTCSQNGCGDTDRVQVRYMFKRSPKPMCQACYLECERGIADAEAAVDDPKPRPAAFPGTVPQVFGLSVGVWASRGIR